MQRRFSRCRLGGQIKGSLASRGWPGPGTGEVARQLQRPRVQVRVQMLNQWLHAEISAFGLGGEEEAEEGEKKPVLDF